MIPFTLDHLLAGGAVLFAGAAFALAAYIGDHVWPMWERGATEGYYTYRDGVAKWVGPIPPQPTDPPSEEEAGEE